jgi:hypothetical protein
VPEALWQALIVAAGAFVGSVLGNVVRPLLEHWLQGKADRRQRTKASAELQFTQLYKPLYDSFEEGWAPDASIEEIPPEMRDHIVDLVNKHRHLAEPELESYIAATVETRYMWGGAIDAQALEGVWRHVKEKYNLLRGDLGHPHRPWWRRLLAKIADVLSVRRIYSELHWRWLKSSWSRRKRKMKGKTQG